MRSRSSQAPHFPQYTHRASGMGFYMKKEFLNFKFDKITSLTLAKNRIYPLFFHTWKTLIFQIMKKLVGSYFTHANMHYL